jgi:hypothetical protein
MEQKTVRELCGEIWAEITMIQNSEDTNNPIVNTDFNATNEIIELAMGVLARHIGTVIINDEDFPVEPLTKKFNEE